MRALFRLMMIVTAAGTFCVLLAQPVAAQTADEDRESCQKKSGDTAIAACTRAISSGKFKGKALAMSYIHRGAEWKGKNQIDKALADYATALRLDPGQAAIYNNRANILVERGDTEKALADYNTAIKLDPAYTAALTNRGLLYEEKKNDLAKARADFEAALKVPAKHSDGEWAHDTARERLEALKGK